jgi:ribonuclease D
VEGPRLVDRQEDLEPALAPLRGARLISLDTEFAWERTYRPVLALVQVGARDAAGKVTAVAVDPLRVDLAPLDGLLGDPTKDKVVHAGRIDLQIMRERLGAPMTRVFDTQRAAALVGFGHQIGYAALVEQLTGKRLSKVEQWSDWTRRPLRPEQVAYALEDVIPLLTVHDSLRALLDQTGRAAWADDEMSTLHDPASYVEPEDHERWRTVKQRRGLDRRALGVLREVAAWRERAARERDVRPGFLAKDPTLIEIARRQPASRAELEHVRGLHPAELKREGDAIIAAVRAGLEAREDSLPRVDKRPRGPDTGPAVELMRAWLSAKAEQVGVASEAIATTRSLEHLARAHLRNEVADDPDDDAPDGEEPVDVLRGWRGELVGKDLLRLLRGELSLRLDPATGTLRTVEG